MSHQVNWAELLAREGKWAELLLYYQGGIAANNFLLQSYRTLFLMLEAMMFAGALTLMHNYGRAGLPWYFWLVWSTGLFVTFLWMWVCEDRHRRMRKFRQRFKREIEKGIPGYKVGGPTFTALLAQFSFNFVLPLVLLAVWLSLILPSPSPSP